MLVAGKKTVSRCKLFLLFKNPLLSVKYEGFFCHVFSWFLELLTSGADCGVNSYQVANFYLYHSVIQSLGMFFKLHSHSVIQFIVSESTDCFCFKIISILNNLLCLFQVFCNLTSRKINICQKPEESITMKIPIFVTKNKNLQHLYLHIVEIIVPQMMLLPATFCREKDNFK